MSKTQLQANNTKLASLIETLKGKAAGSGGGSGGESVAIEGVFSYTSEMSSPGSYDYFLTSDELLPSTRKIIIVFVVEKTTTTYTVNEEISNKEITSVHPYFMLRRTNINDEYLFNDVSGYGFETISSPYGVDITDNGLTLFEITIDDVTTNNVYKEFVEFRYYAI